MKNRALWALAAGAFLCAAAPPVSFTPTKAALAPATEEYRRLWQVDGPRIVASLEAAAGVSFPQAPITVLVTEGASMAAFDGRSIRLRASHSPEQRKAMLIHELGHRLSFVLSAPAELDDHHLLYLFLYDAWCDLYGQDFADRMVAIERRNSAIYDYDGAWGWALAMSHTKRQARLQALQRRLHVGLVQSSRRHRRAWPHPNRRCQAHRYQPTRSFEPILLHAHCC